MMKVKIEKLIMMMVMMMMTMKMTMIKMKIIIKVQIQRKILVVTFNQIIPTPILIIKTLPPTQAVPLRHDTQQSATPFEFSSSITLVNALSSPQSPVIEHPTPPLRSPASPDGSVTYSSGASSTGTDRFSCVIQTPGTSITASDQTQCEITSTPIVMGKNNHNYQQAPKSTPQTTTQYTRTVIYSGNFTTTNTARPEVRGKPGDKKVKKKTTDDENDEDETSVITKKKKRKAKGKGESDDDQEEELSDEHSNPDVDMNIKEKKTHESDDDRSCIKCWTWITRITNCSICTIICR